MPEISRFYGIIVYMYGDDHLPPHFHAEYAEEEALISIAKGDILKGKLSAKQHRLVKEWLELHRNELTENFENLQKAQKTYKKIKPLE
jgi:Domain of unknown function (DUF4160)